MFHRSKTTRSVDGDAFKEATIIIKISTQHLQQGNSAEDKFSNEDQLFYKEHEKKLRWNLTWHKERGERPWGEKWFPGYGKKKGGEEGEVLRWNSQNDQFSVPNSTHKKFSSKNSKHFAHVFHMALRLHHKPSPGCRAPRLHVHHSFMLWLHLHSLWPQKSNLKQISATSTSTRQISYFSVRG